MGAHGGRRSVRKHKNILGGGRCVCHPLTIGVWEKNSGLAPQKFNVDGGRERGKEEQCLNLRI